MPAHTRWHTRTQLSVLFCLLSGESENTRGNTHGEVMLYSWAGPWANVTPWETGWPPQSVCSGVGGVKVHICMSLYIHACTTVLVCKSLYLFICFKPLLERALCPCTYTCSCIHYVCQTWRPTVLLLRTGSSRNTRTLPGETHRFCLHDFTLRLMCVHCFSLCLSLQYLHFGTKQVFTLQVGKRQTFLFNLRVLILSYNMNEKHFGWEKRWQASRRPKLNI